MRVVPRVGIASASETSFGYSQRLHRPEEYSAVLAARRTVRGQRFDLHYSPSTSASSRLGLIVPKRLAKAASLRNAVKRQAREAFRLNAINLPGVDLVLRLSKPLKGVRASDGEQCRAWRVEIESLLKRLPANSP